MHNYFVVSYIIVFTEVSEGFNLLLTLAGVDYFLMCMSLSTVEFYLWEMCIVSV